MSSNGIHVSCCHSLLMCSIPWYFRTFAHFLDSVNFLMYLNTTCKRLYPFLMYFLPYILLKTVFSHRYSGILRESGICVIIHQVNSSCLPMTTEEQDVCMFQQQRGWVCVRTAFYRWLICIPSVPYGADVSISYIASFALNEQGLPAHLFLDTAAYLACFSSGTLYADGNLRFRVNFILGVFIYQTPYGKGCVNPSSWTINIAEFKFIGSSTNIGLVHFSSNDETIIITS